MSSKYTHGKAKHGDTADEQLVLLGETDPAGRAEDTILDLRVGLRRSSLYNKGLTPSYTHTHEYMTEEQNKTRSMRAWTQHAQSARTCGCARLLNGLSAAGKPLVCNRPGVVAA